MSIQTPYFEYRVKMYSILVQILPGLETGSLTVNLTIRTPSWVVCEASIVLIQLITPIIKTFHQGLNLGECFHTQHSGQCNDSDVQKSRGIMYTRATELISYH